MCIPSESNSESKPELVFSKVSKTEKGGELIRSLETLDVKFKIDHVGDNGSYTFSNIKFDATNEDIYGTALAIASLMEKGVEAVYKIVDYEIK